MVLWTWLNILLKIFIVKDKDTGKPRLIMGSAISTVTNLAGVHGNSVAIAIGVSVGVMLCMGAFVFYQYRKLQKKVNRLMLAIPEAQFVGNPKLNHQFLRNLAYNQNQQAQNNQAVGHHQRNPGGIPDA